MLFVVVVFFAAALALAFAAFNFAAVKKMPEGTERMSEIAARMPSSTMSTASSPSWWRASPF